MLKIQKFLSFFTVYLSYPTHKRKIGKYLLQDKYIKEGKVIQVCQDIDSKRIESNPITESALIGIVHIACIWYYDPISNITEFDICFCNSIDTMSDQTFKRLMLETTVKQYLEDEYNMNSNLKIYIDGLQKELPHIPKK